MRCPRSRRNFAHRAGCAIATALAIATAGCGAGGSTSSDELPPGDLTVYASLPLHGVESAAAAQVLRGERLALRRSGGRVASRRLRLVVLDDTAPGEERWTPQVVSANARRAAADGHAIAYLGEHDTGGSAVSAPLLDREGILQVSPTDTFAGLTEPEGAVPGEPARFYPNPAVPRSFMRVVGDDVAQARALAAWMSELHVRRLLVLHDGSLSGASLAEQVAHAVDPGSVDVAGIVLVDLDDKDLTSLQERLRASRADAVFFAGMPVGAAARLWSSLHAAEPAARLFGPDALALPAFAARLGDTAGSTYLASPASGLERGDQSWAPYGYAAMALVLDALRRAGPGARTRRAVVEAALRARRPPPPETYYGYRVRGGRLASPVPIPAMGPVSGSSAPSAGRRRGRDGGTRSRARPRGGGRRAAPR
jgi:branched-chain amino acid transport system substrate-binding protein